MLDSDTTEPGTGADEDSTARILVAEDNELNQKLFRMILEPAGYDVRIVGNGREALEAVRQSDVARPFDAVLMDLQMPEMDGIEATRRIRESHGPDDLPIIAVTAFLRDVGRDQCVDSGVNDYLEKPFRREDLEEVLGKWLKRPA